MTLTHPPVTGKLLIGSDFWKECPKAPGKLPETMEADDRCILVEEAASAPSAGAW